MIHFGIISYLHINYFYLDFSGSFALKYFNYLIKLIFLLKLSRLLSFFNSSFSITLTYNANIQSSLEKYAINYAPSSVKFIPLYNLSKALPNLKHSFIIAFIFTLINYTYSLHYQMVILNNLQLY